MQLYKLSSSCDINKLCEELNVTKAGRHIISNKSKFHYFFIKNLNVVAANILKQDSLAIGGELATPKNTITHKNPFVDCLLILTNRQIDILSKKLLSQDFGLKQIAKNLKEIMPKKTFKQEIMAVLNITPDSFYAKSRIDKSNILNSINTALQDGADYIDIGAQSSRPQAEQIGANEELERLKPIFEIIKKEKLYEKISFSIDSYHTKVMQKALDTGFNIINDITGLENDETCILASKYKAKVIIMHMQNNPEDMQNNPKYKNVILEIDDFFTGRIKKAKSFGCEDIVLDVGIGFGKNLEHNLDLIRNLEHFTRFDYPLLVGASRKSLIDLMHKSKPEERLSGSLSIHQKCLDNKASIIRCHDVKEHKQMIDVWKKIC